MSNKIKKEFGDFQTPFKLAEEIVSLLKNKYKIKPEITIEPSCGKGSFVCATCKLFTNTVIYAFDINQNYINIAQKQCQNCGNFIRFKAADFFKYNWKSFFKNIDVRKELLIIGNPPWITNSELGSINGKNIPIKKNFDKNKGIEAITGKANFDISEWIILQYLQWMQNRNGTIAQLCKFSVARKIINHIEKNNMNYKGDIYLIDAQKEFNVSVKACLLVIKPTLNKKNFFIYKTINSKKPLHVVKRHNDIIVRNIEIFDKWNKFLLTNKKKSPYIWRTGIKHDCAKVMELEYLGNNNYKNGFNEVFVLEDNYIYPLLKSSDIANKNVEPRKWVLVTQKKVGENTDLIAKLAPLTWKYLMKYKKCFENRKSKIYKNKPMFSIFGIGEYSFRPWKIAISGMYKKIDFVLVPPFKQKPTMFDDTINFLSFNSLEEATFIYNLLKSKSVLEFLDSMIFWDAKRPITTKILNKINFYEVAKELKLLKEYKKFNKQYNKNH